MSLFRSFSLSSKELFRLLGVRKMRKIKGEREKRDERNNSRILTNGIIANICTDIIVSMIFDLRRFLEDVCLFSRKNGTKNE